MLLFRDRTVRELVSQTRRHLAREVIAYRRLKQPKPDKWAALIAQHDLTPLCVHWEAMKIASFPDASLPQSIYIIPFTGTKELFWCYYSEPCPPLEADTEVAMRHLSLTYHGDRTKTKQSFAADRTVIDLMLEDVNLALLIENYDVDAAADGLTDPNGPA